MIISIVVPQAILRILWWAMDKCTNCGGRLIIYYWDKSVCEDCGSVY